jgi:hypothetical protein
MFVTRAVSTVKILSATLGRSPPFAFSAMHLRLLSASTTAFSSGLAASV